VIRFELHNLVFLLGELCGQSFELFRLFPNSESFRFECCMFPIGYVSPLVPLLLFLSTARTCTHPGLFFLLRLDKVFELRFVDVKVLHLLRVLSRETCKLALHNFRIAIQLES
jgi:hypothetical protein